MANYVWPPALPQVPQRGFSESVGANIIRTPTDQGPAKQRRRSLRPSTMGVSFLMTTAQVAILQDFLYDTLQGVKAFDFIHPRTGYTVNTRVVPGQDGELFKSTYAAPDYWTITLNFEILPTFTTLSPGSYNIPINRISQFSRTTTATYIDDTGILKTAQANEPRIQSNNLLVESSGTNLTLNSSAPSGWAAIGVTIGASATAPDGTSTAVRFLETSLSEAHTTNFGLVAFEAGKRYVFSVFAAEVPGGLKRYAGILLTNTVFGSTRAVCFDLANGTTGTPVGGVSEYGVQQVSGGYRIWLAYIATTTASAVQQLRSCTVINNAATVAVGDTASGIIYWGRQIEQKDAGGPSSYIPSESTRGSRGEDLVIISAT